MKFFAVNLFSSSESYRPSVLSMTDFSSSHSRLSDTNGSFSNNNFQFKKMNRYFKKSPYVPFLIVGVIVVVFAGFIIKGYASKQPTSTGGSSTTKTVSVAKSLAQQTLNKNFDFPLKDAKGKVVSKIHYEIQSAELDNQIIIKGQIATAVEGRAFLVLNLKITNDYDQDVQLNTRDYVRLVINNSSDRLAADIHNDPVDVQAISTKYTRIGFPIAQDAKNLKLEVGEIDGTKQSIPLNLQ